MAQSLLKKYLTPELEARLRGLKTANGVTLEDVIRSGQENPDSSIGVYVGDAEAYSLFAPLLDSIINEYHQYSSDGQHRRDFDPSNLRVNDFGPAGEKIISTRIRVGRNVQGFAFPPAITAERRLELEKRIIEALMSLQGDLAGQYFPLSGMDEATRQSLVEDHFLFKQGDRFLEAAGVNRDWPEGRGIFHSADKRFLVWINEEDSLRIISMQKGGDLLSVFDRLSRAVRALEEKLPFAYNDRTGYLSSCPTNLGTALRASFHIALPELSKRPYFKEVCTSLGLQARGVHGEHSESEGGVYDISNRRRLGVTEVEGVQTLCDGIEELLKLELALEG